MNAGEATPAPRLTLSRLVELQLAALARTGGEHSTVKLTRNARGETQVEVSVRSGERDVETADDAAAKAVELYDALVDRYRLGVKTLEALLADALERELASRPAEPAEATP